MSNEFPVEGGLALPNLGQSGRRLALKPRWVGSSKGLLQRKGCAEHVGRRSQRLDTILLDVELLVLTVDFLTVDSLMDEFGKVIKLLLEDGEGLHSLLDSKRIFFLYVQVRARSEVVGELTAPFVLSHAGSQAPRGAHKLVAHDELRKCSAALQGRFSVDFNISGREHGDEEVEQQDEGEHGVEDVEDQEESKVDHLGHRELAPVGGEIDFSWRAC